MGKLASFFRARDERRAVSFEDGAAWEWLGGAPTAAGVQVSTEGAMAYSAVYACVRVLSETVASLPLKTYKRVGQGKEPATDFYLYELLHDRPNPVMTSFEFRETLQAHLLLWGNFYCEVERDGAGRVAALWPLRPDKMRGVSLAGDRLTYEYELPNGGATVLSGDRVWHVRGLGSDGLVGYSPIQLARQPIGLGLAAEEYGARFFGNGARPGGILQHPGKLGDKARANLRAGFNQEHGGLSKMHRLAVLEEGMTYQQIGIPPEDAQFLQTRKYQRAEIAGLFRVPPHMIGDLERATFSNIEHQSIEFVVHTVRPWVVRWEQSINRNLLSEAERKTYFAAFLVDGLLRGDIMSRYQAYATGRQNGWLSADDIRELENMNPLPDGQGEMYLVPLNMVPASEVGSGEEVDSGQEPVASEEPEAEGRGNGSIGGRRVLETRARKTGKDRQKLIHAARAVMGDTFARVIRREAQDVMAAAKRMLETRGQVDFLLWLDRFYDDHEVWTRDAVTPMFLTYVETMAEAAQREAGEADGFDARAWALAYAAAFASRHVARGEDAVRVALQGEDAVAGLQALTDDWKAGMAESMAQEESVRAGNATTREVFRSAGVTTLRWMAVGEDTCPYCSGLDGKVVGIEENFLNAGQELSPEGAAPFRASRKVMHPPVHGGCDCVIVAA